MLRSECRALIAMVAAMLPMSADGMNKDLNRHGKADCHESDVCAKVGKRTYDCLEGLSFGDCKTVDLSHVSLGDEGGKIIADALAGNRKLKQLFIPYTEIEEEGAAAIYKALEKNTFLERLYFHKNKYAGRKKGVAALAKMIKKNKTLKSLSISYHGIDSEGSKELIKALRKNVGLIEIFSKGNHFSESDNRKINELIDHNKARRLKRKRSAEF